MFRNKLLPSRGTLNVLKLLPKIFPLNTSLLVLPRIHLANLSFSSAIFSERSGSVILFHDKNFSSFTSLFKKLNKVDRENKVDFVGACKNSENDTWNLSNLKEDIREKVSNLQSELTSLRMGGEFNLEILEKLRVTVQRNSKKTERLGDLGQIIPKSGRSLVIIVGEKAHVKSIISAIQASSALNLQPVQDPNDPTILKIAIPSPTKESRDLKLTMISKAGEKAITGIRFSRGLMQKRLRNIEIKKLARPDDLKRAHKEMEKIVEDQVVNVKRIIDTARKAVE